MTEDEKNEYLEAFRQLLEDESTAGFELYKVCIDKNGAYKRMAIFIVDLE